MRSGMLKAAKYASKARDVPNWWLMTTSAQQTENAAGDKKQHDDGGGMQDARMGLGDRR